MEVSTLRDRRLVALFATLVIGGAGGAAAVMSLEGGPIYRGPAATEAALAPLLDQSPEPSRTSDPKPDPSPVVVVAAEDPPGDAPQPQAARTSSPTATTPAPAPATVTATATDPCATADGSRRGPRAAQVGGDCAQDPTPPKPTAAAEPAAADGPAVVVAEVPDPPFKPEQKAKPGPQPKADPKPKPGAPAEPAQGKGKAGR